MKEPIVFFVAGKPQPAGSKRSFIYRRKGMAGNDRSHFGAAVTDANPKSKSWQAVVRHEAQCAYAGEPWGVAIDLTLRFTVERPKGHWRAKGTVLRDSAPAFPTTRPDSTKLCRGVEDALTGLTWVDDSQIVSQHIYKRYGARIGVEVTIKEAGAE